MFVATLKKKEMCIPIKFKLPKFVCLLNISSVHYARKDGTLQN